MLADYLCSAGAECTIVRNNDPLLLQSDYSKWEALVLSPGPGRPEQAGFMMEVLKRWNMHKPVLGICLGHQALGLFFGASLVKAQTPRHGKVDQMIHASDLLFEGIPESFLATRYHSLILENLPTELQAVCYSGMELMGLNHTEFPVWGLQFHPESCQTEWGHQLIKNFLRVGG